MPSAAGGEFLRVEKRAKTQGKGPEGCALYTYTGFVHIARRTESGVKEKRRGVVLIGRAAARQSHSVMKLFHSAASIGAPASANGAPVMDYASYGIGSAAKNYQPTAFS